MILAKVPTWLLSAVLSQLLLASDGLAEPWTIEVRETAGIQRFSYPLTARFQMAKKPDAGGGFLLRDGDRQVSAQFSLIEDATAEKPALWEVDFGLDMLPLETRTLRLDHSKEIQSEERAGRGLKLERGQNKIRVKHPSLEFVVNEDFKGLFDAIRINGEDWLEGTSRGLVVDLRDGSRRLLAVAPDSGMNRGVQVVKSGPLAVRLRFLNHEQLAGGKSLRSTVQLDFPLGKSWAKIDWMVDDEGDLVERLGAELRLRLEQNAKQPIMGDFGANGWTYAALRPDESIVFQAGLKKVDPMESTWRVDRERDGQTAAYALPSLANASPPVQGWAHLMDRQRCTAIAVDRFADNSQDTIRLFASGQIALQRKFGATLPGTTKKRFTFWLHLVNFPPQLGAATSPQSMQTPPEVSVSPSGN